jgi:hypothetical protein
MITFSKTKFEQPLKKNLLHFTKGANASKTRNFKQQLKKHCDHTSALTIALT